MWKNQPLHREMLLWRQCSQSTGSPAQKTGKTKSCLRKSCSKWLKWKQPGCSPKFKLKMPRLHSGAATDRPEITHLTLPPIPEVVWQQPKETHVTNIDETLTNETQTNTQMPESKKRSDVESQTSPKKETSSQVSVSSTEPLPGNQTGGAQVQSLNDTE